jgi:2-C-methyl-D-erythritol 4-phosphate cytidylyltransferase
MQKGNKKMLHFQNQTNIVEVLQKWRSRAVINPPYRYYAIIPAAGNGRRLGKKIPKQYQMINNAPMLYHSILALTESPYVEGVIIALSPNDLHFDLMDWHFTEKMLDKMLITFTGGDTRQETVLNTLMAISPHMQRDDWILVHDAARPGLETNLVEKLISSIGENDVGGILAVPVADTLKRETGGYIIETQEREHLWQAQTPQMFRFATLWQGLQIAQSTTDEASAIESMGFAPKLIEGNHANFKVTYPEDLKVIEAMMQAKINNEVIDNEY